MCSYNNEKYLSLLTLRSLGDKFITTVSPDCVENYADLFEQLECNTKYSPYDKSKDEYIPYNYERFEAKVNSNRWRSSFYTSNNDNSLIDVARDYREPDSGLFKVIEKDKTKRWSSDSV